MEAMTDVTAAGKGTEVNAAGAGTPVAPEFIS
jgi:hypothetical protein